MRDLRIGPGTWLARSGRVICTRAWIVLAMVMAAAPSGALHAGGFYLPQQTARGTGMGEAGIASPGELSLLHRNPAALSFLNGTVLSLGSTVVMPDTRFVPDGGPGEKMQSQVLFPPNVALSYTLGSGLSFGISASTPFAMKNDWNDDWSGARDAVHSEIRVLMISPGIAFRLGAGAALGVAINVAFPHIQTSRRVPAGVPGTPDPIESFDGTGGACYGMSLGLMLRPSSSITLGLCYTSRVRLTTDDATVQFSGLSDSLLGGYPVFHGRTSMTTPDLISAGVRGSVSSWLKVEADVSYALWSNLGSMEFTYKEPEAASNVSLIRSIAFNWKNSWSLYSGVEIPMGDVDLRAGYVFEQTPVPDQSLSAWIPDADRRGFSAGLGYWVSPGLRLDFAYQYLRFNDRRVVPVVEVLPYGAVSRAGGVYSSNWTVLGIGVSYFWK